MEKLNVIIQIAFRNLFASKLKTAIVGGIIGFGAWLVVVGGAMVDSVVEGMSRSIIGSASGNIQVYSTKSKEDLAIWGQMGADSDLAAIDDFSKLKTSLEKVPNVKAVVPMGISGALVPSGNTIDVVLSDLRDSYRKLANLTAPAAPDAPPAPADETKAGAVTALHAQVEAQKGHVRHIVEVLAQDQKNRTLIADQKALTATQDEAEALARASTPAFWGDFEKDPLASLEFLENKIAPQAADADLLFLRYMGTDLDTFQKSFDRMEVVDGTAVPAGQRGFLFAKYFYEETLKLKTARRLDKMRDRMGDRGITIATDPDLQRMVRQNMTQTREIVLQLDAIKAARIVDIVKKATDTKETELEKMLSDFFNTTDANFESRYQTFYKEMAPLLQLYRIRVGDTLTIKAYTKSGYVHSVNVKVFGAFQFKGLEKSNLSGSMNLIDLATFRDLYGFMTPDSKKELDELKKRAGATTEVKREDAEADLFGEGSRVVTAEATPGLIDHFKDADASMLKTLRDQEKVAKVFTQQELEAGAVLNAAVFLKDPSDGALKQSIKDIEAQTAADQLPMHAVSWQKASGNIGQFALMLQVILIVMVMIIFSVALVIINNALVMATLERVKEIGTLRAIGAQKNFILLMLFIEAVVVGLVFGGLGALLGAGTVQLIAHWGIPATSDIMYFLFSGPRLIPFLHVGSLIGAFVVVLIVSGISSFYPALLAMRVSPLVAMQTDE